MALPLGIRLITVFWPRAQTFNAAIGRIAEIALSRGAMHAAHFAQRAFAHGRERGRVAEEPVHVHVRDCHGIGNIVQNALIPVRLLAQLADHDPQGFGQMSQAVAAVDFKRGVFASGHGVGEDHAFFDRGKTVVNVDAADQGDEDDNREAVEQRVANGTFDQGSGLQTLLKTQQLMKRLAHQDVSGEQESDACQEHGADKGDDNFRAQGQAHAVLLMLRPIAVCEVLLLPFGRLMVAVLRRSAVQGGNADTSNVARATRILRIFYKIICIY